MIQKPSDLVIHADQRRDFTMEMRKGSISKSKRQSIRLMKMKGKLISLPLVLSEIMQIIESEVPA